MKNIKVAVLRAPGTNCDYETAYAFSLAGAEAERIHINEFLHKKEKMEDYHILAIPGGFAYGDYIASGRILAHQLRFNLKEEISDFAKEGRLIIGICNGFQVLVKAGLLPEPDFRQRVTLINNDIGRFQDRWVNIVSANIALNAEHSHNLSDSKKSGNNCIFTKGIGKLYLPINHGEGKFVAEKEVLEKLEKNGQVAFRYCDEAGNANPKFPHNPNGSLNNIAAICSSEGNVFGMMPHPEKFVHKLQHPRWTRESLPEEGAGLKIFRNAVEYASEKF